MKKIFSLMMLVACSVCMYAQVTKMYVWKNGSYTVCPVENVDSITFAVFDYKAVDLGLPSGTLWADRNVGADAPEAYGDYFAWGEVTPRTEYSWTTYKLCNGSGLTMIKYCKSSYYGTVDGMTTLELQDDAAYVNMGTEWRMPTRVEQDELRKNCTFNWKNQNGVMGYKVIGPNGNSIFLPAAGYYYYSSLTSAGSYGYYWSSSLSEDGMFGSNCAYEFDFGPDFFTRDLNNRFYGQSVRAVMR